MEPEQDKQLIAAEQVDAYYDAMLVNGMSQEAAREVESMRSAHHEQLSAELIKRALAMPMKMQRW